MDELLQPAVTALQERFGATVHEYQGEVTLTLNAEHNVAALTALRDEFGFNMLVTLTAVDYLPQEPRFNVVYQVLNLGTYKLLRLRVPVSGLNPVVPTVEKVFPVANWHEREVFDMFGIRFEGHSDMRRILMPADWQGHPLRKDYPLGYEEVQFSFNYDEIMQRKPKGKHQP